ncbi:MAG TPA: histidine phosphatase family protein [Candidatus Eisenbacteria bacterium]|jgi:serine/threonine-protein phosphatase PGAM5
MTRHFAPIPASSQPLDLRPRFQRIAVRCLMIGLIAAGHSVGSGAAQASTRVGAQGPSTAQAPGTRTIYLIRHGHYHEDDSRDAEVGKALTPLGLEQAGLVARRLAALPVPITRIHCSTMTRARQTAAVIARALPGRALLPSRDLRECTPAGVGETPSGSSPAEMKECREQLERAFRRYFRPTSGRDSSEVIACHGNVIRYFWCRALGADPRLWRNLRIAHCSLTVVEVRPDGVMRPISFNDVGHLPPKMQTYASPAAIAPEAIPRR